MATTARPAFDTGALRDGRIADRIMMRTWDE